MKSPEIICMEEESREERALRSTRKEGQSRQPNSSGACSLAVSFKIPPAQSRYTARCNLNASVEIVHTSLD